VFLVLGVLAAAAPLPGRAAAPGRRVVVARPANADAVTVEALARVRGELEAAGFEIVAIPVDPAQDQRTIVETIGRDDNPVAAFAIFPGPRSPGGQPTAEIWVSDRQKGKATVQRMRVDPQDADRSAAVLAVYAVELLKASLADLWVPEARRKPEPEATPPPPPPPDIEPPAGRPYTFAGFGLELAGGVLAHAGGLDSTWTPALRVSFGGAGGLAVRLGVAAGGQRSSVANAAGSARLSHQIATVGAVYAFRPAARVQPFVAAGAGVYRIGVSGVSNDLEEWLGRSTQLWTAAMSAAAGVTVALGQHMAVIVGAEALLFLPRPVIELGEDTDARVGQAGRPALLVTAGLLASR
jgi:hypothetical protein